MPMIGPSVSPAAIIPARPPAPTVPITVGASIQAAINANPVGTKFFLPAGTWNNQVIVPKVRNQFIGDPNGGTILHGNDVTNYLYASDGSVDLGGALFENIRVTHYGTDTPESRLGAVHGISNATFKKCIFDFNLASGLNGVKLTALSCRFNDNMHSGLNPGSNSLIMGCELARNNARGDDINDDVAAMKCAGGMPFNLRFLYNYVHDNPCAGLWTDYASGGHLIRGNTVINNIRGIMVEVCPPTAATILDPTEVSHNVCNGNTQMAIFVSSCARVAVNNNNIKVPAGSVFGLLMQNSNRGGDDPVFEDNTALNNTITFSDASNSSGARNDVSPGVLGTGNTIDFTSYFGTTANNHWFWFTSADDFAAYKTATGQDANSTCTTGDGSVEGFLDIGGNSDPC